MHPDLGIGGAERFIVDIAVCLQNQGHSVVVYTSHYSQDHCFEESRQLNIRVHGDWIPRHIFNYFHILFSIIRAVYLAIALYLSSDDFDLIVSDQVSFSIPILKQCAQKVFFIDYRLFFMAIFLIYF